MKTEAFCSLTRHTIPSNIDSKYNCFVILLIRFSVTHADHELTHITDLKNHGLATEKMASDTCDYMRSHRNSHFD